MDLQLAGRSVLVTGASKGIGLSIAQWFAREGCILHLVARSNDLLLRLAQQLRDANGVTVRTYAADLSSDAGRTALMRACPEVDILINNAGDIPAGSIDSIDDASWRAGWDLKVFGYISLTRHYLARMKGHGKGVIINVIGTAGERPLASYVAGSMGNASLMSFTVALGVESPAHGVRVLGVNPGPTLTERVMKICRKRAADKFGDPERYAEMMQDFPFGRPASCDEVAASVVFLASDLCAYTSGTVLTIDGGFSRRGAV